VLTMVLEDLSGSLKSRDLPGEGCRESDSYAVFTISKRDVGGEDTGNLFWLRRTTTDERATADDQAVRYGWRETNRKGQRVRR
jgi:hypothetical protein